MDDVMWFGISRMEFATHPGHQGWYLAGLAERVSKGERLEKAEAEKIAMVSQYLFMLENQMTIGRAKAQKQAEKPGSMKPGDDRK